MNKQNLTKEEVLVIDKIMHEAKITDYFKLRFTKTGRQYFWNIEDSERLNIRDGLQYICNTTLYGFDFAFEFGLTQQEIDTWNDMIDRFGLSDEFKAENFKEREILHAKESTRKQTMKKLNITKKKFSESKYFTTKYGKLKYVSESGKIYKTSKGHLLKFINESQNDVTIDDFKRMYGNNAAEALIKYCDVKNKDAESVINGSDADMARFENWAKKVLHIDIYDKFSGYDYDSDLDDSRSEVDESSNDDMDKEFKYKGITITRYDYESLPYPMAASQVDDRTMMNIAKEIYNLFIDNGWSDIDIQKYGADIDEIADDNPEMDMFHDEWWAYMEKAAIKYGMPYYEDMNDED